MKTTKILIALTAIVALGVLATGIVLAQNIETPYYGYSTNTYTYDQGFLGWLGGCFRGYNQPYYPYQPVPAPQLDSNSDLNQQPQNPLYPQPQQPIQPQNPGYYYGPQYPNQGYYPRSYGRGCWGW